jgi:hypothetical protein
MRNEALDWILVGVLTVLAIGLFWASRAECDWCYTDSCYIDEHCGPGCACVTVGDDPLGTCVGGLD